MAGSDEFEALAKDCIANHKAIIQHGSAEMQIASRMLLYALAKEIRRQEGRQDDAISDKDEDLTS